METDEEKSPQQLVMEAIWTYAGWAIVILACIGAGVFIGHVRWGDATALRAKVDQYEKQVLTLKNERETLNTRIAKATQERDACQKAGAAGAAAAGAAAAPGAAAAAPGGVAVE
jgi:predicted negative regulator of RcsB-dependent stress response